MAYKEHKISKELLESPVEELCGSPETRSASGEASDSYAGLKGPEGLEANGGIKFALVYEGLAPHKDQPSDTKQFKGQSEV